MTDLTIDGIVPALKAAGITTAEGFSAAMTALAKQLTINQLNAAIAVKRDQAGAAQVAAQAEIEELVARKNALQAELNAMLGGGS